jgi:hypothetical protein
MNTEPFVELDVESQIDWNAYLMHSAPTVEERRAAEDRLRKLHAMRTPEKVRELEKARGLR